MNPEAAAFLAKNRIGVLAVQLPDGSPHAATVHVASSHNPTKLYVFTDRSYKKCEGIKNGETVGGSIVFGFDEGAMHTLQIDGKVRMLIDATDIEAAQEVYFAKFPEKKEKSFVMDPDDVFIEFTPTWWRFSDYTKKPPLRITSEEE